MPPRSKPHDELDEKLARIRRRLQAQSAVIHEHIADCAGVGVAEEIIARFQAFASYHGPDRPEIHGRPYNFDLRGHAHASANAVQRPAESETPRPADQPYRGKTRPRKRTGRRTSATDRSGHPKPTWHDVQDDR